MFTRGSFLRCCKKSLGLKLCATQWQDAFLVLTFVLLGCSVDAARGDLGPSNVLVVYNDASPDGLAIADYYAQAHPGVHLLGLSNVTTSEDISASGYLNTIRPQILPALTPSIDVIVTTKGLPLRIDNTATGPSSYTDPFGVTRSIPPGSWQQYSSLESELTRIDTISTVNQMGDDNYTSSAGNPNFPAPSSNPYYQSSARPSADFNYSTYYNSNSYNGNVYGGMRLTSRLMAIRCRMSRDRSIGQLTPMCFPGLARSFSTTIPIPISSVECRRPPVFAPPGTSLTFTTTLPTP